MVAAMSRPVAPLVSVIMIFLDAERFIEEAIESVLAQTYTSWELILVDDGSSDASTDIARRHAAERPERIRYIEHAGRRNRGMSASRNAGIAASHGELIAFLDADDVYRPEKLEKQVGILLREPQAAMAYGATEHWYSWTGRPEDAARDKPRRQGVPPDTLVPPPTLVPLFLRHRAQTPGTCGVLVRREAVRAVGGFEDHFDGMFEDQAFVFKLCLSAPVFVEGGSWDRYRQHPQSFSGVVRRREGIYTAQPVPSHFAFLEWLERHVSEQQITDKAVRWALRHALRPYRRPLLHRISPGVLVARTRELTRRAARILVHRPRWARR